MFMRILVINLLIFKLFNIHYLMALAPRSHLSKIDGRSLNRKSTKVKLFNVELLFGDYKYTGKKIHQDPSYTDLQKIYTELMPYYTWGDKAPQAFLNDQTRDEYSWLRVAMAAMAKQSFLEYHEIKDYQRNESVNKEITFTPDDVKSMVNVGQGLLALWKKVEPEFENQKDIQEVFANFVQKNLYFVLLEAPSLRGEVLRDAIVFQLYDHWTRFKAFDSIFDEDYWKQFKDPARAIFDYSRDLRLQETEDQKKELSEYIQNMDTESSSADWGALLSRWRKLLLERLGQGEPAQRLILDMLNRFRSYYFSEEMNRMHPPEIIAFLTYLDTTLFLESKIAPKLLNVLEFVFKSFPRVLLVKPGDPEYVRRMQGRMMILFKNRSVLETLSESISEQKLEVASSLLAHLIDFYAASASDFDEMGKINLEKIFVDILNNVDSLENLVVVFKVLHEEMNAGDGWEKNLHQNLNDVLKPLRHFETTYKKLLEVSEDKRPEWVSAMERDKNINVINELGILKDLLNKWSHVNRFTVDFKAAYRELQVIYKKWAQSITILAVESEMSQDVLVFLSQIAINLSFARSEAEAKASLQEQLEKKELKQPFNYIEVTTGWQKNLRQNLYVALRDTRHLERNYKELLAMPEDKRPKYVAVIEEDKNVNMHKELEALTQLLNPLIYVNWLTLDFKTIHHSKLQFAYNRWVKNILPLAVRSRMDEDLLVRLGHIAGNLKLALGEMKKHPSLKDLHQNLDDVLRDTGLLEKVYKELLAPQEIIPKVLSVKEKNNYATILKELEILTQWVSGIDLSKVDVKMILNKLQVLYKKWDTDLLPLVKKFETNGPLSLLVNQMVNNLKLTHNEVKVALQKQSEKDVPISWDKDFRQNLDGVLRGTRQLETIYKGLLAGPKEVTPKEFFYRNKKTFLTILKELESLKQWIDNVKLLKVDVEMIYSELQPIYKKWVTELLPLIIASGPHPVVCCLVNQMVRNLKLGRDEAEAKTSLQKQLKKQEFKRLFDYTDVQIFLELSKEASTAQRIQAFKQMMDSNEDLAKKMGQYLNGFNRGVQVNT